MKNKEKIICIDFDGTIFSVSFPKVGKLFSLSKEYINKLWKNNTIVINTCRSGEWEGLAKKALLKHGIKYDWINCNPPELIEKYGEDCRKLSAHHGVYIDDKQVGGLPHNELGEVAWDIIYSTLNKKHNIY